MKRYFIEITICVIIGNIISCIFNVDPTATTALLIACCALYKHYDKEERLMLIRAEKPITKEQYKRAQECGGYIPQDDLEDIFSQSVLCGYGVYNAIGRARYNQEANKTTYVVEYITSTNCD